MIDSEIITNNNQCEPGACRRNMIGERPLSIRITSNRIDDSLSPVSLNVSSPESGYIEEDAPPSMPGDELVVNLIHFNDCYNVEPTEGESSGAAGFLTAVKQYKHLEPIILFSGDILSPSFMSTFTKGEQMIPVLNDIGVECAVYGNHEFDYGVDNLISFAKQTKFPWLLSNVIDKETSSQLGEGKVFEIIERHGVKFGLVGLIEEEWLSTLSTIGPSDVIYKDFCDEGQRLARWLRETHHVDYVIALTHMRTPNDLKLADEVPEIDLILGGHDHVYEIIKRPNGGCVIKSGTDFREFSNIELKFAPKRDHTDSQQQQQQQSNQDLIHNDSSSRLIMTEMKCERCITVDYPEDEELKKKLEKFQTSINDKMEHVLGQFNCDLDGTFSSIRTSETNLGNFVCDIMLASTHADVAILNSGTLRSDRIHTRGNFTMRDLFNILGYIDPIAVLLASGEQIHRALENGVSQWPKLEGRFPQVSGCTFEFDPRKPAGQRIDPSSITIGYDMLDLNRKYRLTTKAYLASGKDGYDVFRECPILVPGDETPDLTTSILNHFEAVRIYKSHRRTHHRQSLVCISHSSLVKMLENMKPEGNNNEGAKEKTNCSNNDTINKSEPEVHDNDYQNSKVAVQSSLPPLPSNVRSANLASNVGSAASKRPPCRKAMSIDQMEIEQAKLEPKVEGRIRLVEDYNG